MKTICYLRVSSPKNGKNKKSRQTTDSQKLALQRYCKSQGIKKPTYIEDYATGRNQERQGFQQVINACRQGKCSTLIVWKLDRLGRSMLETIKTIQELMTLNVEIIVTTQGLKFDNSAYSNFVAQMLAALAELESNHASERIKAGLTVAREKGKTLGRPIDNSKRNKLIKWQKQGLPVSEQAKRLNVTVQAVYQLRKRLLAC